MPIDPVLFGLFIVATAGFIFSPGPIVSLVVAETLRDGPRHGLAVVAGATTASSIYLTINLFGFASIAVLPDTILDGIRYAGAVYLYFLAFQAFSKPVATPDAGSLMPPKAAPLYVSYVKAVIICATSPKTILFFAAFFPQFITEKLPLTPQLITLSITFLMVAFLMDMGWVFTATKAKNFLTQKDKLSVANKISGGVLAAGATLLLFINN
jgi:threonine/homoserine/homoserine lactone efflux protein